MHRQKIKYHIRCWKSCSSICIWIDGTLTKERQMEYFLREDLDVLDQKIEETREQIKKALREIGDSCQQGSETSHDNPGFEEGQRAVTMWSRQLRSLAKIRNGALIVPPPAPPLDGKIRIGHIVTVKDLATKHKKGTRLPNR